MAKPIKLKGGFTTTDIKLDRVPEFDERSRQYQIATKIEQHFGARPPIRSYNWFPGVTLDQGNDGACVGFSTSHRLAGYPVQVPNVDNTFARNIYFEAQKVDEWPGGEYPGATPVYSGTSVLAGMKVAKTQGYISEYRWIGAGSGKPMEDVVDTLGWVGGIVFGIDWYNSMYTPRPSGLIEVDFNSGIAGGHAIYAFGMWCNAVLPGEGSAPMNLVVFQQSWGTTWGIKAYGQQGGMCYMKLEDVEQLLLRGGEGAVPTEVKLPTEVCPWCGQLYTP